MSVSAIRLSPDSATKTENDQAAEKPTPSEIRITAAVLWDVKENMLTWDGAITHAAANLEIPRAAVAHCIKRSRDYFLADEPIVQEAAAMLRER